jgi:hypothetical protein
MVDPPLSHGVLSELVVDLRRYPSSITTVNRTLSSLSFSAALTKATGWLESACLGISWKFPLLEYTAKTDYRELGNARLYDDDGTVTGSTCVR